jgi:hypothetical protein
MKKAPMSRRERALKAQVERLKKRLQENEALMHQAAVKIEEIEMAQLALREWREAAIK